MFCKELQQDKKITFKSTLSGRCASNSKDETKASASRKEAGCILDGNKKSRSYELKLFQHGETYKQLRMRANKDHPNKH